MRVRTYFLQVYVYTRAMIAIPTIDMIECSASLNHFNGDNRCMLTTEICNSALIFRSFQTIIDQQKIVTMKSIGL